MSSRGIDSAPQPPERGKGHAYRQVGESGDIRQDRKAASQLMQPHGWQTSDRLAREVKKLFGYESERDQAGTNWDVAHNQSQNISW